MEIRYSFSLNEAPVSLPPVLLCLDDCQSFDLPGGMVMLLGRYSGNRLAVTRDVFIALQACSVFRTLDEHVAHLIQRMPELASQPADVKRVLESIRDAGLFIDAQRIVNAVQPQSAEALGPLTVAILTCDRPAALERLLDSMDSALCAGLVRRLLIIDDSRQQANVQANHAIVTKHAVGSGRAIEHVDTAWRTDYLQKLTAKVPEAASSLRFLLDAEQWPEHRRYGLVRTWALLLSAGSRLAMFDDDVLCEAIGTTGSDAVLSFTHSPRDAYECALPGTPTVSSLPYSPLVRVDELLGASLGAVLTTQQGSSGLSVEQLRGAALSDVIELGSDSAIMATACGTCGDPGTGPAADWLMGLPDDCLEPLAHNEEQLQQFLGSRNFWMGRMQPTVSSRFLMSGLTGLDARAMLPPYFPVMRGEDLLFGCLLALMYPSARVLDFDWSVPHLPVDSREHLNRSTVNPPSVSIALLEESLMAWAPLLGGTPTERLQEIAGAIQVLVQSATETLVGIAEAALLERRVNSLKELARRQAQWPQAAPAWRQLVDEAMQRHQEALMQTGLVEQMRESSLPDDAALIERFRHWASDYAEALKHWPAIWRAVETPAAAREAQH